MRKIAPYLANGRPKTCWGCGEPFVVREGRAEAIVGPDCRLYCYGKDCADEVFAAEFTALKLAS